MAKLWSWALVSEDAADTEATIVALHAGSVALLLAATQIMSETWRWDEFRDAADMDSMEALLSQANEDIMTEIELCERVLACVADSGGSAPGGGNPNDEISEALRGKNLLPDDWECDNDHAFGMARAVNNTIQIAATEVFQKIETASNNLELAAEVADNVPIASTAGVALEMILWVQETVYEQYQLAWNQVSADTIACELYCKILDGCSLTYQDIMDVFTDLPGVANPPLLGSPVTDWMTWLFAIPMGANVQIVKAGGLLGLIAMYFGSSFSSFFRVGVYGLETVMALARNATSSDWEIVCDECPETAWTATASIFTPGLPAFVSLERGILVASGAQCAYYPLDVPPQVSALLRVVVPGETYNITGAQFSYLDYTQAANPSSRIQGEFGDPPSYEVIGDWYGLSGSSGDASVDADRLSDGYLEFLLRPSVNDGNSGAGKIGQIQIRGDGENPFVEKFGWVIT